MNLRQPDFLGRLDALKPGKAAYSYDEVTNEGVIVEHPDKSRIMQHIEANGPISLPTRHAMQGFEGWMAGTTAQGVEALFAYRRIAGTGWILASVYPMNAAFAPCMRCAARSCWPPCCWRARRPGRLARGAAPVAAGTAAPAGTPDSPPAPGHRSAR